MTEQLPDVRPDAPALESQVQGTYDLARRGSARIVDRGYRRYTGPRRGTGGAVRSLIVQTLQRILGIRRPIWSKIWPVIVIAMAYIPAIVFVGITVLAKQQEGRVSYQRLLPSYGQYYGFVTAAIVLFVAFVAPEVLCTDRKTRMLGLYLASPLNRTTYLLGKAAAVAIALSFVTVGPPLLVAVGYTVNDAGPDGFGGFVKLIGQVILGGVVIATLMTALSLAISSTTSRKWAAMAATIVVLLGALALVDLAVVQGRGPRSLLLLNPIPLSYELVLRIYGDPTHANRYARFVDTPVLVAGYVAFTAACCAFVWWRYRRVQVTR